MQVAMECGLPCSMPPIGPFGRERFASSDYAGAKMKAPELPPTLTKSTQKGYLLAKSGLFRSLSRSLGAAQLSEVFGPYRAIQGHNHHDTIPPDARGVPDAMSGSQPSIDVFDVRKVRKLINLMKEHDLTEIDLKQADSAVRIKRGGEVVSYSAPVAPAPAPAAPAQAAAPAAAAADAHMVVVKSPMVGTFYQSSSPDNPPFVKVGDRIGPEKTVCIVEAMKVFNEIPAGVSGQVVAILVENNAPVEFGQPLIKVDPTA
jgi:acetyl-CoA carboxylase biotin carboxyl carrier protein